MQLTVTHAVVLQSIQFAIGAKVTRSGRMASQSGYMICEGEWQADTYDNASHPFKIEAAVELSRSEKLMEEIIACSRLEDVYQLEVSHVVIQTDALERTADRQYSHRITLHGKGHVSKEIWEELPFKSSFPASPTVCAMLRDILRDVIGAADMQVFPRKSH